jgi:hypothetical protein
MKTTLALALALMTTACGQLTDADLASLGISKAKSQPHTRPVDVVVNAPAVPEPTASTTREPPAGTWAYGTLTCDFGTRLCSDGSVVGFDSVGPIVVSPAGEKSLTTWAEWTQAE